MSVPFIWKFFERSDLVLRHYALFPRFSDRGALDLRNSSAKDAHRPSLSSRLKKKFFQVRIRSDTAYVRHTTPDMGPFHHPEDWSHNAEQKKGFQAIWIKFCGRRIRSSKKRVENQSSSSLLACMLSSRCPSLVAKSTLPLFCETSL